MNKVQDEARENGRLVAVIDVGSSAIRMVVAEVYANGGWKYLDGAFMPTTLGRDVFDKIQISAATTRQVIQVLGGFRESLTNWRVAAGNIRCIATSAVREARNRDMFMDRVALATGFQIEVIAGVEENQMTYLAVRDSLADMQPQFGSANTLIIEVGGGEHRVDSIAKGQDYRHPLVPHRIPAHGVVVAVGSCRESGAVEFLFARAYRRNPGNHGLRNVTGAGKTVYCD